MTRALLPSREEVEAETDVPLLRELENEIERRLSNIETDLEFNDGDDEWFSRAKGARSYHTYLGGIVRRRINQLTTRPKGAARINEHGRQLAETFLRLLVPDADATKTIEECEGHMTQLSALIERLDMAVAQECSGRTQCEWDQTFLMSTKAAKTRLKNAKHALTLKVAGLRKAAKEARTQHVQEPRERLFIESAREILPPATFAALWDRVDRQMALDFQETS